MKQSTLPLFFLCFCFSFGQNPENQTLNETIEDIKKEVWVPFMEAYDQSDPEKLKSIHTKDIIRVIMEQGEIKTGESYLENFADFVATNRVGIAFAILSTSVHQNGELAYQNGYYRFSSKGENDDDLVVRGYGEFNVGLRKENGSWKIWLDSDKRVPISHEVFSAQKTVYKLEGH